MTEVRAHVERDPLADAVRVYLGVRTESGLSAGQPTSLIMEPVPEGVALEPMLRLPDQMARALYDALAAHFGGTSDVRALRQDLDVERARTDRLIEHLAAVAAGRADG